MIHMILQLKSNNKRGNTQKKSGHTRNRQVLGNTVAAVLVSVLMFYILFTKQGPSENRNIIWMREQYVGNYTDIFSMKYDEHALDVLDSAFLTRNDYFNAAQQAAISKSIEGIRKVSAFRSKYKHDDNLMLGEAQRKFNAYKIYGYNLSTSIPDLKNPAMDLTFNSESCALDLKNASQSQFEKFLQYSAECTFTGLQESTGNTVVLGPDHAYTEILLRVFKMSAPDSKLGMIVFDEHIDIYGTKDANNILGKENIFGKNLVEGNLDKVIFIGVSPDHEEDLSYYLDKNFTATHILGRIEVLYDTDYESNSLHSRLSESIRRMKEEGITHILFSIDVDVLPEEYTGFEYSIIAPAMSLAKYYKYYEDYTPVKDLVSFNAEDPFFRGLTPEEIIELIRYIKKEASRNNIMVGFAVGNTTIIGDIEELLLEQDIDFETTEQAAKIATVLVE